MSLQIPLDVLAKLWPHATPALRSGIASSSAVVLPKYGIQTLVDLTDFLAQDSEETAGGIALVENLRYSAERLMVVWPSRFPTLESAQPYAYNQQVLANFVYGGRGGNTGPNDGWNFRGRGLIQITFRDNYQKIADATGLDLINHPELLIDPLHALECACAYWQTAGISAIANSGDFTRETIKINGGTTNMAARLAWRKLWAGALNADNTNAASADPSAPAAGGGGGSDPAAGATTGPKVTNPTPQPSPPASVPPVAPPPPASTAPPLTPVLAPSIKLDYGDFLVQFISHLEPMAETAVNAGVTLVENQVPGLGIILSFFGQKMVGQYVAAGAVALEGLLAGKSLSVTPTNALETMVLTAIQGELPTISAFFSNELPGWISAAVAHIAPSLVIPAAKPA